MELQEWREQQEGNGYTQEDDQAHKQYLLESSLDDYRANFGDEAVKRALSIWYVKQAIN